MKRKIFLVLFTIFLISLEATIIPYGNVYGTWDTSGSPYLVNGDIFITAGEELNIEPGVIIEFQGRFRFRIYGRIVAAGTETDSIIFTSNDPETGWRGMRFYNTNENEQDSSLVSYCRFEYGKALIGSYGDRRGGAIYCYNSSDICFNHCLFINNEADYGGGMALYESSPLISNSIFDSNISYHDGGGLIISSNSEPDFVDVTISRNQCNFDGGGIFCSGESELVLSNVLICENMAVDEIDGSGAGIACWGANLILNNVVISGNRACWGAGGIECIYASSMYLTDVIIEGNRGQSGAGIYIGNDSEAFLSGTTVRRNQTQYSGGGGIYIGYEADVNFDQVNRCNIYLNACTHYNATGMDLYSFVAGIDVYVDTFTVAEPTELFANPIYNFNFDIEQGLLELTDENIYVSPEGADINSGLTPEDPIRSIFQALLMAQPDAEDPVTIYLAEGTYSPSLTGEIYPLPVHDNFILQGSTTEQSILDAEYLSNIFYFYQISDVTLSDLILQHGSNWQGGAIYSNYSEFSINNTIIRDNKAEYNGGGICAEYANTITMDDVVITNNATDWGPAGGIYISSSTLNLTGCTIKENRGGWQTGGIWISSSNLNFDPNNRCNIYFNVNTSGNTANDLGCNTSTQVTVIVDTFTVLLPDNYYASPIANFTFDILNAIYDPVDADLYVNPEGS
ncbi:MAG: hypothetical protein JXB60_05555, partial [Candidatus Cloacimonetes bacterium]|nr:hypothetical protein [Candidatus Cloacimonadota bacterium]